MKVLYALQTVTENPGRSREMVGNIEPVGILGEMAEAVRILSKFLEKSTDGFPGISR